MPRKVKRHPVRRVHVTDEALATLQELTASVAPEPATAPAATVGKRRVGRPRGEPVVAPKDSSVPRRGRGRPPRQSPQLPHPPATSPGTTADGDAPLSSSLRAATPAPQPSTPLGSDAAAGSPVAATTEQDEQLAAEGLASSSRTSTAEAGAPSDRPAAPHPPHRGALRRVLPLSSPPPLTATPPLSSSDATVALPDQTNWDATPSLPACLAAVFGWRLASYGVTETGYVRFTLQRREARVAVEGAGAAFAAPASASAHASGGTVRVNGTLVPIGACAEHLRAMADSGRDGGNRLQTAPPSLASSSSSTSPPPQDAGSEASASSPRVQAPSPMSPITARHVAEQQARKRARSRSPSPAPTAAPPLDASLLSPAPVRAGAAEPPPRTEAPAPSSEPQDDHARGPSPPPERVKKVKAEVTSPSTRPRPPGTTSDDEEDDHHDTAHPRSTFTPLVATLSAGIVAPSASSPPPRAPSARDTDSGHGSSRAAQTRTAAAAAAAAAASVEVLPAAKEAVVAGPTSATGTAASTTRQRRVVLKPAADSTTAESSLLAALPSSTATPAAPPAPTSSPAVPALPRTGDLFRMPFELQRTDAGSTAAPRDEADAEVDGCRTSLAKLRHGTLVGLGFTASSSRRWLAHTHAASRALACMPPPVPSCSAESGGGAARQQQLAQGTAVDSDTAAAAVVRQLLRQRWRARSSLWAAMDDALRVAVGSGHLRGDPLAAGVLALQAGEEEQRRYDGVSAATHDAPGVRCGRGGDGEFDGTGEDGVGARAAALPDPTFPAPRPHALLPVSGRAVVEAQYRIADTEEAHNERLGGSEVEPRYTVCPGGIPPAERIAIDHTYSIRGSYRMASTPPASHALALLTNPHEDLRYHVYKNLLMADLREAVEAEGTVSVGSDGVMPVQPETPPKTAAAVASSSPPTHPPSSGDEEAEDEDGAEAVVRAADGVPAKVPHTAPASNGAEYQASTDIDYILRYRPAIRRIPMPDVESRYGV